MCGKLRPRKCEAVGQKTCFFDLTRQEITKRSKKTSEIKSVDQERSAGMCACVFFDVAQGDKKSNGILDELCALTVSVCSEQCGTR